MTVKNKNRTLSEVETDNSSFFPQTGMPLASTSECSEQPPSSEKFKFIYPAWGMTIAVGIFTMSSYADRAKWSKKDLGQMEKELTMSATQPAASIRSQQRGHYHGR
jgi:hypothetical protein